MADAIPTTSCVYSTSGHFIHLIQIKLAYGGPPPREMRIIEITELGARVSPVDDPAAVETWCMHQEWRDVVHAAVARGDTRVLAYSHNLAVIGDRRISHTAPEAWRECPRFEDLRYWERPYFTEAERRVEIAAGRGAPKDYR